jgi:hypothetical protein
VASGLIGIGQLCFTIVVLPWGVYMALRDAKEFLARLFPKWEPGWVQSSAVVLGCLVLLSLALSGVAALFGFKKPKSG